MKDELLNIIHKKTDSYFRDFAFEIYNTLGQRKANTPMAIMGRFETLKVQYNIQICKFLFINFINFKLF